MYIRKVFILNLQQYRPCDVVLDGDDEFLVLVFDKALGIGGGVLEIEFSAVLNAQLRGLYKWYENLSYFLGKL